MGKILITGNGFDLFHHLPTKYQHFISIMQTIEEFAFKDEVSFEDLFGRYFKERFLNDFESIVENYNVEKIKFDNSKIKKIDELLKENLWYKYFKTVLEIETWIDFEVEVENVLGQLKLFNKFSDNRLVQRNDFRDSLIEFSNFEMFNIVEIYSGSGDFTVNSKYINQRKFFIDLKIIIDDLLNSFDDFIKIFNRYLVDVVSVFYNKLNEKPVLPFHLINDIYTFNYTPTFENIYNIDKSKIVYLHGKINDDSQLQNLVLGVSEITDEIRKNKVFGFTKYYQKVNKNSNNKFIEVLKKETSGLNETIFYLFGHSLDSSDKEYINDLFDFLKYDKNKYSKICVFYFNESDKINKWNNLFSIIEKDLILEMNKEGRLYFVKLNTENILKEFNRDLYADRGLEISIT